MADVPLRRSGRNKGEKTVEETLEDEALGEEPSKALAELGETKRSPKAKQKKLTTKTPAKVTPSKIDAFKNHAKKYGTLGSAVARRLSNVEKRPSTFAYIGVAGDIWIKKDNSLAKRFENYFGAPLAKTQAVATAATWFGVSPVHKWMFDSGVAGAFPRVEHKPVNPALARYVAKMGTTTATETIQWAFRLSGKTLLEKQEVTARRYMEDIFIPMAAEVGYSITVIEAPDWDGAVDKYPVAQRSVHMHCATTNAYGDKDSVVTLQGDWSQVQAADAEDIDFFRLNFCKEGFDLVQNGVSDAIVERLQQWAAESESTYVCITVEDAASDAD